MITLKNIKKSNDVIECEIIPEDSGETGYMIVRLDTKEIENVRLPKGYEWCRNHIGHAKTALLEISKYDDIPKEKLVMWN